MRVINTNFENPYLNMAIDEALLTSKEPVLRFYRFKPSAITIGYFQSLKNEINLEQCKKQNIKIVRRITGGKAVFHENDLTYSFIINKELMPPTLLESYKKISTALIEGLLLLGLNPKMKDENIKKISSSNCFNEPSYYELTINNKKFVGSAQKRKDNKILQHGIILIEVNHEKLCSLFNNNTKQAIEISKNRVTAINNELNKKINYNQLAKSLIKGFKKTFKMDLIESKLTNDELKLAIELKNTKYYTNKWNYMK